MKKSWWAIVLILLTLISFFCKKNPNSPVLPDAYINIYLYPNSIDFIPETGYIYYETNPPSRGIIIYRFTTDQFIVFERTCTYDPDSCCTVQNNTNVCSHLIVELSGLTIIDTCCQSRFQIIDGFPIDGPATYPLKQYQTEYDGEVLHIFN